MQYFNGALNFFRQKSGLEFYYNYLLSKEPKDFDYFNKWIQKPESRKAIHVGNRTFDGASIRVYEDLYDDMFKSVKPWIEDLLDANYKVCHSTKIANSFTSISSLPLSLQRSCSTTANWT